MCQKLIEKYSCGDTETATFPCEDLLTDGTCKKPEDDKAIDHGDTQCRECQHMEDALKQIAEDANLAPEPRKGGEEARGPSAPKKYFIEFIKWSKCCHHSHPKWTDIERFDDGPELGFEIEGLGRCHGCSEADPQTLARMEKDGALAKTDPWGAMEREPDVAAESSGAGVDDDDERPGTEAIALNITNSALKDLRTSGAHGAAITAGRRAIGDLPSQSLSPEFDTSAGKGKGRHDHKDETYASRHGAAPAYEDSDDDGDLSPIDEESDSETPTPHTGRRGALGSPPSRFGLPSEHHSAYSDIDSEDEFPRSHHDDNESPLPRFSRHNHNPIAEDQDEDEDEDEDDREISIDADRCQRLAIPAEFKLTRKTLMRFEARRKAEGMEAMTQHHSGGREN